MASFRSLSRQKRDTSSTPSISSVRPPRALNSSHAPFSTQMTQDMPARPEQPPRMGHRLANIAIARPTALSDSPLLPKLTEGPVQNEFRERASSPVTDISQRLQNKHENATGLPDDLKTGIEHLSGLTLDDVRVYYHSPQPARVDALAFTQGTQIHVASGQEQHLAHEAWHVVQQKQGRVKPTLQARGVMINNDERLEQEAEQLGKQGLAGKRGTDGNHSPALLSGSREGSHADQPLQRFIRLRVNGTHGPKIQTFGQDQDAFAELGSLVIFRWYLGKVTGDGKTPAAVKQALTAMQTDQQHTWDLDVADQHQISTFLGEVDRRLGLAQPTWNLQAYLSERQQYQNTSIDDIGVKSEKPSSKRTIPAKKPSSTETEPDKETGVTKKPVNKGNVLGAYVEPTSERTIAYTVKGLTGTKIRDIFVSPQEKEQLDQLYQSATATMKNEQYPTFKQLKADRIVNDTAMAGVEIELKGMYIDVSEVPHVAVAAAIAGHKPIAERGNVELHIDAAAGSGMALIEIVTKPLRLQALVNTLAIIKEKIKDKKTLYEWIKEFGSSKGESETQAPKDLILTFILKNWDKKVKYKRVPVAVQLTTSLTEKEFAGKIREHTIFPHIQRGSATLTEVLESRQPKKTSTKRPEALIKHAYEQLPGVESDIPEDTAVDKVPFEYTTGKEEKAAANLRTDANKLSPLITRNGDLAFLVEYRGGASTTKTFLNVIKAFLEKEDTKKAAVEEAIKDAFPHLQ